MTRARASVIVRASVARREDPGRQVGPRLALVDAGHADERLAQQPGLDLRRRVRVALGRADLAAGEHAVGQHRRRALDGDVEHVAVGVVGAGGGAEVLERADGLGHVDLQHARERQRLAGDRLELARRPASAARAIGRSSRSCAGPRSTSRRVWASSGPAACGRRRAAAARTGRARRRPGRGRRPARAARGVAVGERVERAAARAQRRAELAHARAQLVLRARRSCASSAGDALGRLAEVLRLRGEAGDDALAVADERAQRLAVAVDLVEQLGGVRRAPARCRRSVPVDVGAAAADARRRGRRAAGRAAARVRGSSVSTASSKFTGWSVCAASRARAVGQPRRGLVALRQLDGAVDRADVRRQADVGGRALVQRGSRRRPPSSPRGRSPGPISTFVTVPTVDRAGAHVAALDQAADVVERRAQLVGAARSERATTSATTAMATSSSATATRAARAAGPGDVRSAVTRSAAAG